jgi:membrane protein DedA with SNARE-associated domain
VLDSLLELVTSSSWTYLLLLALIAGDAVLPLLPSETALIAAGVLAERGDLELGSAIAAGAAGALLGDNLSYLIGRRVGRPAAKRLFRSERAQERFRRMERLCRRRGTQIILTGRFVPGGRTAATFSGGLLGFPWATRFLPVALVAAGLWASSGILLGYFGGRLVERSPWYGIVLVLALAAAAALVLEVYRRLVRR